MDRFGQGKRRESSCSYHPYPGYSPPPPASAGRRPRSRTLNWRMPGRRHICSGELVRSSPQGLGCCATGSGWPECGPRICVVSATGGPVATCSRSGPLGGSPVRWPWSGIRAAVGGRWWPPLGWGGLVSWSISWCAWMWLSRPQFQEMSGGRFTCTGPGGGPTRPVRSGRHPAQACGSKTSIWIHLVPRFRGGVCTT